MAEPGIVYLIYNPWLNQDGKAYQKLHYLTTLELNFECSIESLMNTDPGQCWFNSLSGPMSFPGLMIASAIEFIPFSQVIIAPIMIIMEMHKWLHKNIEQDTCNKKILRKHLKHLEAH